MTGDWPSRVFAFALPYRAVADVFDVDRSRAFLVRGSKVEVLRRERVVKKQFAAWRVNERLTEWFDGAVADDILATAGSFDDERDLVMQTLRGTGNSGSGRFPSPRSPALTAERRFVPGDLQKPSGLSHC